MTHSPFAATNRTIDNVVTRGGRRRRAASTTAVTVAVVALAAAACSSKSTTGASGSSGNTSQTSLAQSGGPGEGPYPWKYPASGNVQVGTGKTISGASCSTGTPQFDSPYAPPCVAKFTGNNGGATYNGVTGTTITLSNRVFPSTANGAQIAAVAKQQGAALPQVTDQVAQTFLNYFNSVYDLYGRKVVIQPVQSTGNATTEALNGGQAQACADADKIAHQVHAFGDVGYGDNFQGGGTSVFSDCAAQQKLVEFSGAAYFDEAYYQKDNPYVWGTPMECERISNSSAEAFAKMLAGKPAIYAGDANLKSQTRKLGTYIPNLPDYVNCLNIFVNTLTGKYHQPASSVNTKFTYGLDISTFQQSVQQAIVQFKAAGVTTIVTACDSYSLSLLTKAAAAQNYHPEWLLNGVAGDDLDSTAQTYDQSEVAGHLFGLSEASPQNVLVGPNSPAGKLYQKITGHQIPAGTDGHYNSLVRIFNSLQAAGPDLTPDNMARGTHALPAMGAPDYAYGKWSFNTGPSGTPGSGDHTATDDARFIYWNATGISPDNGKPGTYVAVNNGTRYTLNDWPTTLPPLFKSS